MKTAIQTNSKIYAIEQALSGIFSPSKAESSAKSVAQKIKTAHKGDSIAHFLWVYVIIFSSIATAVIIAERFFFV